MGSSCNSYVYQNKEEVIMFYNILVLHFGLWVAAIMVMFVGYWTYADYYVKLQKNSRIVFWSASITNTIFSAYIALLSLTTTRDPYEVFIYVFSLASAIEYLALVFIIIITYFIKSKEYFKRKRTQR